jgi:hypothetical protein
LRHILTQNHFKKPHLKQNQIFILNSLKQIVKRLYFA